MRGDRDISKNLGFNRYLRDNIYEVVRRRLADDNIGNSRRATRNRLDRRKVINAVMERLHWDETEVDSMIDESKSVDAPWSSIIQGLTPAHYA